MKNGFEVVFLLPFYDLTKLDPEVFPLISPWISLIKINFQLKSIKEFERKETIENVFNYSKKLIMESIFSKIQRYLAKKRKKIVTKKCYVCLKYFKYFK